MRLSADRWVEFGKHVANIADHADALNDRDEQLLGWEAELLKHAVHACLETGKLGAGRTRLHDRAGPGGHHFCHAVKATGRGSRCGQP